MSFSFKSLKSLFFKKAVKDKNEVTMVDITVTPVGVDENRDVSYGEFYKKGVVTKEGKDEKENLQKYIELLAITANQLHEKLHFSYDTTNKRFQMKPVYENEVTRLLLPEFALYPKNQPFSVKEFNEIIKAITEMASKLHENLHLVLGTIPVFDAFNNASYNLAIHVQCGPNPTLNVEAKSIPASGDLKYSDIPTRGFMDPVKEKRDLGGKTYYRELELWKTGSSEKPAPVPELPGYPNFYVMDDLPILIENKLNQDKTSPEDKGEKTEPPILHTETGYKYSHEARYIQSFIFVRGSPPALYHIDNQCIPHAVQVDTKLLARVLQIVPGSMKDDEPITRGKHNESLGINQVPENIFLLLRSIIEEYAGDKALEKRLGPLEFGNVFKCRTKGDVEFFQAIEICTENAQKIAQISFNRAVDLELQGVNNVIPVQLSHVLISNTEDLYIETNMLGLPLEQRKYAHIAHADPLTPYTKSQDPVTNSNKPVEFPKKMANIDTHGATLSVNANVILVKNPPFGSDVKIEAHTPYRLTRIEENTTLGERIKEHNDKVKTHEFNLTPSNQKR